VLAIVVAMTVAGCAFARHGAIEPVGVLARSSFVAESVQRGAALARVGNCIGCHTAPDGMPFAGGTELRTPFGMIYGTNITPDEETGIGSWSQAAFRRAMREGVSRDGHLLYPAFPYDHFTLLSDGDIGDLYAYVMTRTPVHAGSRADELRSPFGFRPLLAGWDLLYLHRGPMSPVGGSQDAMARGGYLVNALGHCGACHTPRNGLGAEDRSRALAGGDVEGWYAPPLNAQSPSPLPWDVKQLMSYLRTGIAEGHAMAAGPMREVVHELADAPTEDVRAIASYVVATMGPLTPERRARATAAAQRALDAVLEAKASAASDDPGLALGAAIYAGACASCHELGRGMSSNAALRLPLAIALYDADPRSLIRIVRDGILPADGEPGRWMPSFDTSINDEQMTALLAFLRHDAADLTPWPDLASQVRKSRQ
jgi:mono/diheme cytochrome c family protein